MILNHIFGLIIIVVCKTNELFLKSLVGYTKPNRTQIVYFMEKTNWNFPFYCQILQKQEIDHRVTKII